MPGGGHTTEYDFDETKPGGSTFIADGDNWIVSNQQHIDNAISVEHYSPSNDPDESGDDYGRHDYVTLKQQSVKPDLSGSTGRWAFYNRDGNVNLESPSGEEIVVLNGATGAPGYRFNDIPYGEVILFEKNTAVSGYTLITTVDDVHVYIGSGTVAGGLQGGAVRSGGTWTQPNHTHSFSASATTGAPSGAAQDQGDGSKVCAVSDHTHSVSVSGTSGDGATANTWRTPGVVYTRQQRVWVA